MDPEFDQALRLAVRHLARRDRSEAELAGWLHARGVSEEMGERVRERCRQKGWLSDERVAERTVEVASKRRGLGRLRVEHELNQRQVSPKAQQDALERLPPGEEIGRALEALAAWRPKKRSPLTAARWLSSRGFEEEVVRQAIEEAFGGLEE